MGTYGDPITEGAIPVVGTSGTTYASEIDDFLTEVKARLETKVPLSSLAAGTFDLANSPILNARYVGLYPAVATPSSPLGSLQYYGGDLWFVSASGAVQITTGGHVNSASTGGITGDYGLGPEQFRYVAANQEYYAYSNYAGGVYGLVWAKNFDISSGSTGSLRVRLAANAIGTSYSLTFPALIGVGLPTGTASNLVMVDAANGNITYGTNPQSVITGPDFKNTSPIALIVTAPQAVLSPSGGNTYSVSAGGGVKAITLGTTNACTFPVDLPDGAQAVSWSVSIFKHSSAATTITAKLATYDIATGAGETIVSTLTNSDNNTGQVAMTSGAISSFLVGGTKNMYVYITGGADALDLVYQVRVNYTRA